MLRTQIDPQRPLRALIYARMSTNQQNPRSPDQQVAAIRELIQRFRYPWVIVEIYRDDAQTGRVTRSRQQLMAMLRHLKSGAVKADLVLVDTFERLSRAEEGADLRRKLQKLGVFVLTADSNFADPTSVAGKALTMVESFRATEDGRIKAHNVLRGKKDAIRQRHWPGGAAPFGYRLQNVMTVTKGVEEIDYRVLDPDLSTGWIIAEAFRLADEHGWGGSRIAKRLNLDERIPESLRRFSPWTVGWWLDNPIYYGELVWGEHCTGIVDDVRILQKLPEAEWERYPGFCEPLISKELFNRVQALRNARRRNRIAREQSTDAGLPCAGIALKYPLSGLVRCAHCGRSMTPASSSEYHAKAGDVRRYVAYVCPGRSGGLCPNNRRIPEQWLREKVMELIRQRLFFEDRPLRAYRSSSGEIELREQFMDRNQLMQNPMFLEFVAGVEREFDGLHPQATAHTDALHAEAEDLGLKSQGWLQSLGNPSLAPTVRHAVESQFEQGQARIAEIQAEIARTSTESLQRREALDPERIIDGLERLAHVLAGENASAVNLVLSQHIESIRCNSQGMVVIRTCKLGALAGALELVPHEVTRDLEPRLSQLDRLGFATPRRRGRLKTGTAIEDDDELDDLNAFAMDPNRFAGLGSQWFSSDEFEVPRRLSWAEQHSREVATHRIETCESMEKTAQHFGKTVPTIREALRYAKELYSIDAFGKGVSRSTLPNWSRENAGRVAEFFDQPNATMQAAAALFGKSEPTIRKALSFARSADDRGPSASEGAA